MKILIAIVLVMTTSSAMAQDFSNCGDDVDCWRQQDEHHQYQQRQLENDLQYEQQQRQLEQRRDKIFGEEW